MNRAMRPGVEGEGPDLDAVMDTMARTIPSCGVGRRLKFSASDNVRRMSKCVRC